MNVVVVVGLYLGIFISPTQAQREERTYGQKDFMFEDGSSLPMSKTEGEGRPRWVSTGVQKYLKVSKRKDFEAISSPWVGTSSLFDRGVAGREITVSVNGQSLTTRSELNCSIETDIMTSWYIQMVTHFSNHTVPTSCRLLLSKNLQDPYGEETPRRGAWGSRTTSWACVADFTFYPLHHKNLDHERQTHEVPFMGLTTNKIVEWVSPVWVSVINPLTIKIQYHNWILTSGDPEVCKKDHGYSKEKSPIRIEDTGDVISLDTEDGLLTWNLDTSVWDLAGQVPACGPFLDGVKLKFQKSSVLQKIILRRERDELNRWREEWFNNVMTISNELSALAALGTDSRYLMLVKTSIKGEMRVCDHRPLVHVTEHFQAQIDHLQREAHDIRNVSQYSLSCVVLQEQLSTNGKEFLQTLLNVHWPKEMDHNGPGMSDFAKKHQEWWKIGWMGCSSQEADDCTLAALVPVKGNVYSLLNRVDMGRVDENLWIGTQSNDSYIYTSKVISTVATSMCGRVLSDLICPNGVTNYLPDNPCRTYEDNLCPMISEEPTGSLFWQFHSGELCFHCRTKLYMIYHTGNCTVTKLVSPGLYCTDREVLGVRLDSPDRLYQPDLLLVKRYGLTNQLPMLPNPTLDLEEGLYEMSKDLEVLKKLRCMYSQPGQRRMDPTDRKKKKIEKNGNNYVSVSWLDKMVLFFTGNPSTLLDDFVDYMMEEYRYVNCIVAVICLYHAYITAQTSWNMEELWLNDLAEPRRHMNRCRYRG